MLQRLLLVPLLSPLLAVLLLTAFNTRPWVSVRLLIWSSPSWPIGGWIALAAGLGGVVSATGTALALQTESPTLIRRQVKRRRQDETGAPRDQKEPEQDPYPTGPRAAWAGPSRKANEPAPTVAVPFRVIRKGPSPVPPQEQGRGKKGSASATASRAKAANPTSASDDWNESANEDW